MIAVVLIAIFGTSVFCICRRKSDEVQILNEDQNGLEHNLETLPPLPSANNGNETSMHIEDDEMPGGFTEAPAETQPDQKKDS